MTWRRCTWIFIGGARMVDLGLCRQTVTLYHEDGQDITRQVVEGCFYDYGDTVIRDVPGGRLERRFLLVIPGDVAVFPGDRVYDGVGPEKVDRDSFLPVCVPGLSIVQYVHRYRWGGLDHTEAGRK